MWSPRRRGLLVAGVMALGVGACFGPVDASGPIPQQLTDLCKGGACDTTGAARRTTGLTSDTIGYQLGPGAGSVLIPSARGSFSALVRGHGTFSMELSGSSTVEHDIPRRYAWIDVGGNEDGGLSDIRFSVADDGSELHLADLRVMFPAGTCSVVPVGPR